MSCSKWSKPNEVERDEAEYRGAYLLLHGECPHAADDGHPGDERHAPKGDLRPRVTARARYTTESLRPHGIASFEEFERHTPHQEGWVVENKLSVHPEDVDKAVHVLERAGIEVKRSP